MSSNSSDYILGNKVLIKIEERKKKRRENIEKYRKYNIWYNNKIDYVKLEYCTVKVEYISRFSVRSL